MCKSVDTHPYKHTVRELPVGEKTYKYFSLPDLQDERYDALPYCMRVLLESTVRNSASDDHRSFLESSDPDTLGSVHGNDHVEMILDWQQHAKTKNWSMMFMPARCLFLDDSGLPSLLDLAALREAVRMLGGNPAKVQPLCPTDIIVNSPCAPAPPATGRKPSMIETLARSNTAEAKRTQECLSFVKWSGDVFDKLLIVPPSAGSCHQINLEHTSRVVFQNGDDFIYPDSVIGADRRASMVNGLGILAWGVSGIDAQGVLLGNGIATQLPEVVGVELVGEVPNYNTSTDVVLTVTKQLRDADLEGTFVEFFGEGVRHLSIAERLTISSMCREYGAKVGFFPLDDMGIKYLRTTGRDQETVQMFEKYLHANKLFRGTCSTSRAPQSDTNTASATEGNTQAHADEANDSEAQANTASAGEDEGVAGVGECGNCDMCQSRIKYSRVVQLDLSKLSPTLSGPKRSTDRVPLTDMQQDFKAHLIGPKGLKGYGIPTKDIQKSVSFSYQDKPVTLKHGTVMIASITGCTNTSNPLVMLGAGVLAKKAVRLGLSVPWYTRRSFSPGSDTALYYLKSSGSLQALDALGFPVVGTDCLSCAGNKDPLPAELVKQIESNQLVTARITSGNRNWCTPEGEVWAEGSPRANYLASPLLVIAYAIAGTVDIDFQKDPIRTLEDGTQIFLSDIWPSRGELQEIERVHVLPGLSESVRDTVEKGSNNWNKIETPPSRLMYAWDNAATFVSRSPFLERVTCDMPPPVVINARCLVYLGDGVSTDIISPAGSISKSSLAARYLSLQGLHPREYASFGLRRGNAEVMVRGAYANAKLRNHLTARPGPYTHHVPSGTMGNIYDVAQWYAHEGHPCVVIAGKDYGCGSPRDWAAKGPALLGVQAILAESFDDSHRRNLICVGVLPLRFTDGTTAVSLGLTGTEIFTIARPPVLTPGCPISVTVAIGLYSWSFFMQLDCHSEHECMTMAHGGTLKYVLRRLVQCCASRSSTC
ncbi:hypothetical protein SARC_01936 [Sphaeroforma arctica JP610]|uniref:Aconitate hydratase n=1 Tax=Sphaeroforma arctica JP610 TaxID=667725 RepID=A0A0L0GCA5_9EUKA|nr:hypothetical protein SARC_01936 [Sphaeroforma arctica JP610]KNC85898.1 hypothetical protein SARC_01936 [Sphaeroforma arctica JP610]|eukprot:XP_014159800.1 hypothetical protein SARC_01936 [Sphaeroforma arctica JP610]